MISENISKALPGVHITHHVEVYYVCCTALMTRAQTASKQMAFTHRFMALPIFYSRKDVSNISRLEPSIRSSFKQISGLQEGYA